MTSFQFRSHSGQPETPPAGPLTPLHVAPVRAGFPPLQRVRTPERVEWPTIWVIAVCYSLYAIALLLASMAPIWIWAPIAAVAVAWHGSLQHEIIHGHPTPLAWVNRILAGLPLCLWLPYERYRETHLAHHNDEALTDPIDDPEAYYVTPQTWRRIGPVGRALLWANNTLIGRLLIGPWLAWARFAVGELRRIVIDRDWRLAALWARHFVLSGMVAAILISVGIPLLDYALAVVYPATSLLLLRSFAEHRPAAEPGHRTAIVEDFGVFNLLFLSNNLHAVHHDRPGLPWYALNRLYRHHRDKVLDQNGHYVLPGYGAILRSNAVIPRDHPVHPTFRSENTA